MDDPKITDIDFTKIINNYFNDLSLSDISEPNFVLVIGGVGAGKTTYIRENFSKDYEYIDGSKIFLTIKENYPDIGEFDSLFELIDIVGLTLTKQAIKDKRNIVMEHIGDSAPEISKIIDGLNSIGYKVHLEHVSLDPKIAYERHTKAVEEDPNYISTYFFKDYHRQWLLSSIEDADL